METDNCGLNNAASCLRFIRYGPATLIRFHPRVPYSRAHSYTILTHSR